MKKEINILKALSDNNRLFILEMLSCGEVCACDIMHKLELTQPTISHHMKILEQSNLINSNKKGKWVFYSINQSTIFEIKDFLSKLTTPKENCICKNLDKNPCRCS